MKKYLIILLFSAIAVFYLSRKENTTQVIHRTEKEHKNIDKKTRADLAIAQNYAMIKDPATGTVPRERLREAIQYTRELQNLKTKAAIGGVNWTERGPNNVGGRTRSLVFDPADPTHSRVFAPSVAGGLWICDDIYAPVTSWNPVDEFFENLAITTLIHHPINTDTMYFGTGEGYFNSDAIRGEGIWRSFDGGNTWTRLPNTTTSAFAFIQKMAINDAGFIFAATSTGGIQRSIDNGATWARVLGFGLGSVANRAADIDIASNGDIYACMGLFNTDGIYKSTDNGSSWTRVLTPLAGEQRIELTCAPGDPNRLYGITHTSTTNGALNIIVTVDGGNNWTRLAPPIDNVSGDVFTRSQAWYDLSIAVDPNDNETLYVGGIDIHKSTDGGNNWTQVSHWFGGGGFPEVHADQHVVVFAPGSSDTVLFGHDGGVNLTLDATSNTPSFAHQIDGYNVTQFYSCAIHPKARTDSFYAGAQDNGTQQFVRPGLNSTREVTGGDGAFTHIDQDNPNFIITSFIRNQYRISVDGGNIFRSVNFANNIGMFINPTDYDNDAFALYASYGNGAYLIWDNPRAGHLNPSSTVHTFSGTAGQPSAITTDPNIANRIYIGTENGSIFQIDNANTNPIVNDITPNGLTGYVSSIDVEYGNANNILATVSSFGAISVWASQTTGTTWNNVEGNLPDIPVRWGVFSPIGADSVFIATELGVWSTTNLNGTNTNWAPTNTGLANVRTDMLQVRRSDSTILAATHGRGLYSASLSSVVEADFTSDHTTIYHGGTVNFQDISIGAVSWAWDFDNDGITDATTQDANWTYSTPGFQTVTLTINGNLSTTKTDYITVIPSLGTPYTPADGGDFESNGWHFGPRIISGATNSWERGIPANHINVAASGANVWKTDLDADIPALDYISALHTPIFNLTQPGTYDLSFNYRMEAEFSNAPTGVIVEYSTDKALTWTQLGVFNFGNPNNWYSTGTNAIVGSGHAWAHTVNTYVNASQDISFLAGNKDVRFRIVFGVQSNWPVQFNTDGFALDDFTISGPPNDPCLAIETMLNKTSTENLNPNGSANYISNCNNIIATIENLGAHDFGSTTVTIDNEGNGAKNYATNTDPSRQIMEKTFTVNPTTNSTTGNYRITAYFTPLEAMNWKIATGNSFKNMNLIKAPVSISTGTINNAEYGINPQIDSNYNGDNSLAITAEFTSGFSGFAAGLGGVPGPLPLELLNIDGERNQKTIVLNWATASEVNVSHFEIQRLRDDEFIPLDKVNAVGNSNSIRNYQYTDYNPASGVNSYRLKIVDQDGSIEYSPTVSVEDTRSLTEVSIYPSPANQHINIEIKETHIPWDISVIDMQGILISQLTDVLSTKQLDVSEYTEGVYFIISKQGNKVIDVKKVLVIH